MIARFGIFGVLALLGVGVAFAQTARDQQGSPQTSVQTPEADHLKEGAEALEKGDYVAAQAIFVTYLNDNPDNTEALAGAGDAFLGLRQYEDAERYYLAAIKLQPSFWMVHKNLVVAYAAEGKWKEFDQERALLQNAREKGEPGLSPKDADLIEVFNVGPERYIVQSFAELNGKFHARYYFTHFGPDHKPDYWIACESDDVDQSFFAKKHPTEAAAGQRSFSLDSCSVGKVSGDGTSRTQTQALIKFYFDGEPTYETVREDVMRVLEHKLSPSSTTTMTKPATSDSIPPKPN